jgi:protease PrsW
VRLFILIAAIIPPLLMVGYAVAKTRASWRSEAMWNAFFIGAVGAVAAGVIEIAITSLLSSLHLQPLSDAAAVSLLAAAIPEEGIKFVALVALAEKHVDARRLQDIVVLAVAVSLGFATVENVFYVISKGGDWQLIAALRAVTSVPGHGIDGLVMGALLVVARLHHNKPALLIAAVATPVALHAAYDFALLAAGRGGDRDLLLGIWLLVVAGCAVGGVLLSNRVLAKARAADCSSGRDISSIDTTDWLIIGGAAAILIGPTLVAVALYAKAFQTTAAMSVLSILPAVLGIDAVCTGLERKVERNRCQRKNLPSAM